MGAPGNVMVLFLKQAIGQMTADVERSDSPDDEAFLTWDASESPQARGGMHVWEIGCGVAYLTSGGRDRIGGRGCSGEPAITWETL
jgi:hypothetical protein